MKYFNNTAGGIPEGEIPSGRPRCRWMDTTTTTTLLHAAESSLRSQLVLQLIKKFPPLYGTPKFITVLTSARHLSLS